MNEDILKKLEQGLDRRSFLRDSGMAAAGFLGVAAASPLVIFAEAHDKPPDDKKKDDPDKPEDRKDENKARDRDARPSGDSTTETRLDPEGREYRTCPQCGYHMYHQGRTWTCENCGYTSLE